MDADRLQWLVDRELIHDVLVECAHAQDARDWERVARCFHDDATYEHPKGRLDGVGEIVERSKAALQSLDDCQHLLGSFSIVIDGDEAQTVCYFQAQHMRAGVAGGELHAIAGTYRDLLQRRDGVWRIAERTQRYSWRSGNPDVTRR